MMKLSELMYGMTLVMVGLFIGNLMGDQATIKDCAVNGAARMMGGGTVTCTVNKEAS